MLVLGYKMRYAHGVHLNESPGVPWPEVAARALLRTGAELRRMWLEGAAGAPEGEEGVSGLQFVVEPLKVPSVIRPDHEPNVVYVRLAQPRGDVVSVLPNPAAAVGAEVERAAASGVRVVRAVLVGADSIVDPRAPDAPGYDAAFGALVDVLGAFSAHQLPFVWRTRGGIDGQLPHALGQVLVDAGALAVVELGVPSLDDELCAALEGHLGVAPEQRLRLATALSARNVTVRGLVDPLVPMLTDQEQSIEALVAAFAEAGVRKVGARYIVLTRERARAVAARLAGMQRALLQGVFADEPWQKPDPESGQREVHKRIPAHLRRAGHHRLIEAAARHGLFVDILDPVEDGEDLSTPAPAESKPPKRVRKRPQLELFRKSR